MGRLQGFERRLSDMVNGAVAKVFRGQVQPVEIAQALTDEAETRKVVGASRTLVPNRYCVDLGSNDHTRLAPYEEALTAELADIVTEHARDQRWSFVGPVTVSLSLDRSLETGVFRVRAEVSGEGVEAIEPNAAVISEPVLPQVHDALQARLELSDGRSVPLQLRVTKLGRGQDADVRVDDSAVSRHHAEIRRQPDGRHQLADLDSTNGTIVNGSRVSLHWLSPGDLIELGETTLRYTTG